MKDGPTDRELVLRAMNGDDAAFGVLVQRHERRVYNLAFRMLGRPEEARDAAQDALLSCYRRLGSFRGDAAFSTWLHRIVVNACYDLLRKRAHEPLPQAEMTEPPPASDHADRAATAIDVQRALLTLPKEFRAVLIMHDAQGFPYEDIAATLEIPVGTVKSRLHRGRIALARALSGSGEQRREPIPSKPPNP